MGGGWWYRDRKELISEKDAEPGTKQDAVQQKGVSQGLTGGTGGAFGRGFPGGPLGREREDRGSTEACGREASGTPRYRLCSDVLDRCERGLPEQSGVVGQRSRRHQGSGCMKSHRFHGRLRWAGAGRGRRRVHAGQEHRPSLLRGGKLQQVQGRRKQEKAGQLLGSELQTESQPKAPARLHCRQCLRFRAAKQSTSGQG